MQRCSQRIFRKHVNFTLLACFFQVIFRPPPINVRTLDLDFLFSVLILVDLDLWWGSQQFYRVVKSQTVLIPNHSGCFLDLNISKGLGFVCYPKVFDEV